MVTKFKQLLLKQEAFSCKIFCLGEISK